MDEEIIYFRQFPNCRKKDKNGNLAKYQGEHFNLSKLPTETLKKEFRSYIIYRGKNGIYSTLKFDRCAYNHVVKFLNSSPTSRTGLPRRTFLTRFRCAAFRQSGKASLPILPPCSSPAWILFLSAARAAATFLPRACLSCRS